MVAVNANGDACDIYNNIMIDPEFVDPFMLDFNLHSSSPCIDAGDPSLGSDPDGTIADIGAIFFDQSQGVENPGMGQPTEYQLCTAYPNPFNPTTRLEYTVPGNGMVSLNIYDVTGNHISTLVSRWQAAGQHSVQFDATSLPSGLYIYSYQFGGSKHSGKLVLMK